MIKRVILTFVLLGAWQDAAAQGAGTIPGVPDLPPGAQTATPLVTVRLHAGPNFNLMSDWREGLNTLQDRTRQRGLSPADGSCLCLSWGGTALAHLTPRLAIGAEFDMLRDSREFTVTDDVVLLQQRGTFAFGNETVARATQAVAAFYPRENSRMHLQVGAGVATGHTTLSTPASGASGRVRGWLLSTSVGTEARFWYVDAGWRFQRMRASYDTLRDQTVDEARDVFAGEDQVRQFIDARGVDFTGGWARIGLAFHFGRR